MHGFFALKTLKTVKKFLLLINYKIKNHIMQFAAQRTNLCQFKSKENFKIIFLQ